jgi:hypothetical protein
MLVRDILFVNGSVIMPVGALRIGGVVRVGVVVDVLVGGIVVRGVIVRIMIVRGGVIVRIVLVGRIVRRGCRLVGQGLLDRWLDSLLGRRRLRRRLNGSLVSRRVLVLLA